MDISQAHTLRILSTVGFQVAQPWYETYSDAEVITRCEEFSTLRLSLPYAIDGVVLKVNHAEHQRALGEGTRAPKWAAAYKFAAEEAVTTLKNITVQVGRTGALTPVAILEKVNLGTILLCLAGSLGKEGGGYEWAWRGRVALIHVAVFEGV